MSSAIITGIRYDAFGQPVGFALPQWTPPPLPPRAVLSGRYCRVEPLDASRHADDFYAANQLEPDQRGWTYLTYGPFATMDDCRRWAGQAAQREDSLFHAIVDLRSGKAAGIAAYLRIKPDYLAALEDGDFAATPGRAYASGFLRSYADHLALDGNSLAARLKRSRPAPGAPARAGLVRQGPSGLRTGVATLAALLLAGTFWLGYRDAPPRVAGSAALEAPAPPATALPTAEAPDPRQALAGQSAGPLPLAMLVSADSEDATVRSDHGSADVPPVAPASAGQRR